MPSTPRVVLVGSQQLDAEVHGTTTIWMRSEGRFQQSATLGWTMPRDGSITALTIALDVSSYSADGEVVAEIRVNGSTVFTVTSDTVNANGHFAGVATQAAGVDTFSAGDVISLSAYGDWASGIRFRSKEIILAEVEFDT